ncbi:MAG: ribose-5-phosphate isomerase RpiA [Pseudomonadota bacterium]
MSDALKQKAGEAALQFIKDGMVVGIGTGSTAEAFIRALAPAVADGLSIIGVPTSVKSEALCRELGIPLATLEEQPVLDITVDGADELDADLNLIKGAGGALLREKIVAQASREMIVIADQSKVVDRLGEFPLSIEVNTFGLEATRQAILAMADGMFPPGALKLRCNADGTPYVTDGGHFIFDASFGRILDPRALTQRLNLIPGVVENGLFVGLASKAIIAGEDGVEVLESPSAS